MRTYNKLVKANLPDWSNGKCVGLDPEIFFSDSYNSSGIPYAKKICSDCVIKSECLQYALVYSMNFGVWGGTAARDRWKLRRSLKISGGV